MVIHISFQRFGIHMYMYLHKDVINLLAFKTFLVDILQDRGV